MHLHIANQMAEIPLGDAWNIARISEVQKEGDSADLPVTEIHIGTSKHIVSAGVGDVLSYLATVFSREAVEKIPVTRSSDCSISSLLIACRIS